MLSIDKIFSLCKTRGFVFAGSEIYGGLANSWDYGPLGVELKNNIKNLWWKNFVHQRSDMVGLDSSILMNPKVWEASGHLSNFVDPLVDCKACKYRFRADDLLEKIYPNASSFSVQELNEKLIAAQIKCIHCGQREWTKVRDFHLMFMTKLGVTEDSSDNIYLRPETAQGIFIQFKNIFQTIRKKLPFGVAQIGKAFRNEITPGNFIFRTREFEQMEIEYFCKKENTKEYFNDWKKDCENWLKDIGIKKTNIRWKDHAPEELSHYSKATSDIEFHFPFGWSELWGLAHRGNYDLSQHQTHSKKNLQYTSSDGSESFLPDCIEPSLGVDRLFFALLCNSYCVQQVENEPRNLLQIDKKLAPYKVAILPLSKKLAPQAESILKTIQQNFCCDFDVSGSIGKRYRRQDEIGTPYCITFDFDSLQDEKVTLRDRDNMKQERISIQQLLKELNSRLS